MSVKLSSYLWLRNNDLVPLIEDPYATPKLSPEDKKNLKLIINRIDKLHSGSYFDKNSVVVEKTSNPLMSSILFEGIHGILQKYCINPDIYRRLGGAFKEIGAQPNPDFAEAIKEGTERERKMSAWLQYGGIYPNNCGEMCWESVRH